MTHDEVDPERLDRVFRELMLTVLKEYMDEETRVVMVKSIEVVEACERIIAIMMESSPLTKTARGTREYCEHFSKDMRKRIAAYQEARARGEMDFLTIMPEFEH